MADNFQQFCESIDDLTGSEKDWVETVLGANGPTLPTVLLDAGIRVADIDPEYWPDFEWDLAPKEQDPHASELLVYSQEHGSVSNAAEFARAFLARFRPQACWTVTWAETCSKPRVGQFGGGAMFVTARTIETTRLDDWTDKRLKAHTGEPTRFVVPTYNGNADNGKPEFDHSDANSVEVHLEEGLRIVMGTPTEAASTRRACDDRPSVCVERQHDKWVIFVHPDAGDPLGNVEFPDVGPAVFRSERGLELHRRNCDE